MSIRAVVFDIGGVMIRLAYGWQNACRASGVAFRHFDLTPEYLADQDALELDYGRGHITPDEYFSRLHGLMRGRYALDELQVIHGAVIQQEFDGIVEIVQLLKSAGQFTACLSNTCASHWTALTDPARYPAIGRLDARFASHLFGLMKPDPAIFRRFEAETGFRPAEILYFDDGEGNVAAARDRGWTAVHITCPDDAVPEIRQALGTILTGNNVQSTQNSKLKTQN
jgi:putative hydrolase of the HAD superfamily